MNSPIYQIETDVLVVGAGAAGVAAAVSAARSGARVSLIEKNGFAGGMATAAYVGTVCGLYLRTQEEEFIPTFSGFPHWFGEELARKSGSTPVHGQHGLKFLPYDRLTFMQLCDQVLTEAGVDILYHASLKKVNTQENKITGVEIILNNRDVVILTSAVIDTSGSTLIGQFIKEIDIISGDDYQAGGQVFGVQNIEADSELQLNLHLIKSLKNGISSGDLFDDKSWLSVIPGSFSNGSALFKLSIPFSLHDAPDALSKAEVYARAKIGSYVNYLKNNIKAFTKIEISMVAPVVGMRTGPRYEGKYKLSEKEVLSCKKVEHSAAKGSWPIEYWAPGEQVEMSYFEENDYYDIPTDCLVCNQIDNLTFAGRHISASEKAIASARVIGTCLDMGTTAGILSAESIK